MDITEASKQSMIENITRLFNTADETVGVMPFSGEKVTGRQEMWIMPDGERKITEEYLSGYIECADPYRLMLRYSNLTPADRIEAITSLERLITRSMKSATETYGVWIYPTGDVTLEAGGGCSEGVYSIPFVVKYIDYRESTGEEISYYVSFNENEKTKLGVGVTLFNEMSKAQVYERRYIHEPIVRRDRVGEKRSFDFEFSQKCESCALMPLARGAAAAVVYKVFPSGEAEMICCVLTEKRSGPSVCLGTLAVCGDAIHGQFDVNTGTFTEDRTA